MARALALGARGRWFKSSHLDQLKQSRALVAREAHNLKVVGSIPTSATNSPVISSVALVAL